MADAMAARAPLAGRRDRHRPARRALDELPAARAILFDTTPRQLVAAIAGDRLPGSRTGGASRASATGPASSRSTGRSTARSRGAERRSARAGDGPPRRHAGGDRRGRARRRPRPAPRATVRHPRPGDPCGPVARPGRPGTTAWAYCHVPNGSTVDMTERIEAQVERFAPGLPRPHPGPRHARPGGSSSATTRTTSAATSTAASRTGASSSSARPARRPVPRRPRPLPLLVVDAARRRRPRHVRHLAARSALRHDLG